MHLYEREFTIPVTAGHRGLLALLTQAVAKQLSDDEVPVRFVMTATDKTHYHCEIGILAGKKDAAQTARDAIFKLERRQVENHQRFNAVLLVPTGIGAAIGGHAGDAGPVAKLLGNVCDLLITHPNVTNASDINELPENGLYVEGSTLCRLLMGTIALQRVRANRVLFVLEPHEDVSFCHAAINALNAARACYGLDCPRIVQLNASIGLKASYTPSGRAAGRVDSMGTLFRALDAYRGEYDALALATIIDVPAHAHTDYFQSDGGMVNPWGGVEAICTHAISLLYDIPSAHSPMSESRAIRDMETGIVDARMAAEAISSTFLQCIFKGLQRSPRILTHPMDMRQPGLLTVSDVSCLVIPDGCIGLPVLAALEQGIPVIAVRENKNLMRNDPAFLPWRRGQYIVVDNYLEAAGVMCAMKAGIPPESVRRPFPLAEVTMQS